MKKYIYLLLMCFSMAFSNQVLAKPVVPLTPEEAFHLNASFVRPQTLMLDWKIARGYFLYVKRISIQFTPSIQTPIELPQGEFHANKENGRDEVYSGNVSVPISFANNEMPSTMSVDYQGCSAEGFCYPPMNQTFMLNVTKSEVLETAAAQPTTKAAPTLSSLLTDQNDVDTLLQDKSLGVLLIIFLGLGLLLAFTPCVLPMVPILTSIIVGQKHAPRSRQAFFLSAAYVLGMSITYAGVGVLVASVGGSLQVWLQKPVTIIIVSSIFVFLALSLFGLYELRFSRRWHNKINNWSNKHEGGTYIGVFVMGVLSTLVVSPCVTAPLVGVLIYIGQTGDMLLGASALFMMGMGMGLPLLVIGMSAGKWLPKSGPWMKAIKELFGIFMVAMAIWLLSRILTHHMTLILFGLLLLATAGFVGIYLPKLVRFRQINRMLGCAAAILGMFLVYSGLNSPLQAGLPETQAMNQSQFIVVHDMNELNDYLAKAAAASQPVMVDFYANWCSSCVDMDKKVFSLDDVQHAIANFMLLRVDLSNNTAGDSAIMQKFAVVAPPTILFFNNSGHEVDSRRIVGSLNQSEFISRIDSFMTASCDTKIQC